VQERQGDVVEDDLVAERLPDVAKGEHVVGHDCEAYGPTKARPESVRSRAGGRDLKQPKPRLGGDRGRHDACAGSGAGSARGCVASADSVPPV
jgi:hypothetical protein